jgi:hypothetical protein
MNDSSVVSNGMWITVSAIKETLRVSFPESGKLIRQGVGLAVTSPELSDSGFLLLTQFDNNITINMTGNILFFINE